MNPYILPFEKVGRTDIALVGGKNASLGEMYSRLSGKGIRVPEGFATTVLAFWTFIDRNRLRQPLYDLYQKLDKERFTNLREVGQASRSLVLNAKMPAELAQAIADAYLELGKGGAMAVAVRSSATAEDLPNASFAGQHESYLNIAGAANLLQAVQRCYASLFTDRAIKYREDNGFQFQKVALSVGIQRMVRSDLSASGVAFTLEPESGFRDVIHISGVWGLGENLVQGTVTPDEFLVFKPTLLEGKNPILQMKLGAKEKTMVYANTGSENPVKNLDTPQEKRTRFTLQSNEIIQLAQWCHAIEQHYGVPMDIEWAKDGEAGGLYIVQARPETVQSARKLATVQEYALKGQGSIITSGQAIGEKVTTGKARLLSSPKDVDSLGAGEIVVTDLTSPDWDPILKNAAAIVTNKGGRTSHASIVARELGVPAVVGCDNATKTIQDGELITVSCCEGKTGNVYRGAVPFSVTTLDFENANLPERTKVMLIVADPDKAFRLAAYPNNGVGLLRMEFIITHMVQVHPMALAHFNELKDEKVKTQITAITAGCADKKQYFIERLAQGIATIAAAFYPRDVIVRTSDFKTNEYANLVGGTGFEPSEENPMLGYRGASRYYHDLYRDGFALECAALKKVREEMGLHNVKIMIPFCRTLREAAQVIEVMAQNGLDRSKDPSLQFYLMVEIPSNVLLAEEFARLFDGFSIGSNDLTQLTLGIDRDSAIVSGLFNEQNEAPMQMMAMAIEKAVAAGIPIGLCGQAPSDYPEFASFLVQKGITSISFNPDALMKGIRHICSAEHKLVEGQHA